MEANSDRWQEVTPSAFAHERSALEYVRNLLPDRYPFQAWSNFTFLPARLGLVRQLADAVGYAHDRRLVYRALSSRAIVVEPGEAGWLQPRLRIGEWQAAARGLSAVRTAHHVALTTHAYQHVEAAAAPYLAPEFAADADGTVGIDVFGLGATAYLVLTGRPPAAGRPELMQRLAAENGLHPSAVSDEIPPDVDTLIELATAPRVSERFGDVEEFAAELGKILRPARPVEDQQVDPWDAYAGSEVPDGSTVIRVLGTRATARAFLVQRGGLESVLKVGRSAQSEERLDEEALVLEGLRHEHLVGLKRGVFTLGSRHAIEIDYAGEETLAQLLRTGGALVPDQLQRFGDQLLDVLDYLARRDTFHRDVKPDNLGVRRHPKRGSSVVLFDFSLAGAPATDVQAAHLHRCGRGAPGDDVLRADRGPAGAARWTRRACCCGPSRRLVQLAGARVAGRDGSSRTVVLLCPAEDARHAPRIGAHAIGMTSAEEWIVAPSGWSAAGPGAA